MQPDVLLGKVMVLILGLVFLVKGSDFFVKAAAAITVVKDEGGADSPVSMNLEIRLPVRE